MRSRTAEGFVPNYGAGGAKSVDRTEPPLAGRVLRQLYAKFNDTWIVEFLLDDLLDNLDWFWRKRVTPLGLIALGSDPVVNYTGEVGGVGCMQGARWESGLDNSPMYEAHPPHPWFDNVTHHMEGADVGMSSLFVAEAAAVAALARAVNRSGDADALDARAGSVRAQISTHLWDDAHGIFVNRFAIGANTSLSSRVSPTSFYALSAHAATDAQAARMASEWLLNATRFCLSETWPAGVSPGCFWGLPSISADDPAFGGWVSFNANHPAHQKPTPPKNKPEPKPYHPLNPNQTVLARLRVGAHGAARLLGAGGIRARPRGRCRKGGAGKAARGHVPGAVAPAPQCV